MAATLLKRKNQGEITSKAFDEALANFEQDTFIKQRFHVLETDSELILASVPLILRHNLNASDSVILATYLALIAEDLQLTPLFVCADRRFLRAARAEGLSALNPEEVGVEDIPAVLASLSAHPQ